MRIKGKLALYNTALGSNMYLLRDENALSKISIRQGLAFLAILSRSVFPPSVISEEGEEMLGSFTTDAQARKTATLVLQVDMAEYKTNAMRLTQKQKAIRSASIMGRSVTASAQLAIEEQISRIFDRLNTDSLKQGGAGDVRMFGTRLRKPVILPVGEIANLTKRQVSAVDEYYGLPANLDKEWVAVSSPGWQVLAGCSISDAISARLGITLETTDAVLNTLKDVLVDTVVKSVPAGITGLTFVVPPLGMIEFKPDFRDGHRPFNIIYHPAEGLVNEISSELGFN